MVCPLLVGITSSQQGSKTLWQGILHYEEQPLVLVKKFANQFMLIGIFCNT